MIYVCIYDHFALPSRTDTKWRWLKHKQYEEYCYLAGIDLRLQNLDCIRWNKIIRNHSSHRFTNNNSTIINALHTLIDSNNCNFV